MLEPKTHGAWLKYIGSMKGDNAVRDIQALPDNGHLYAAHVINDIWRLTGGNAIIATDVGGTREIFPTDANAAILVPADNRSALADAIRRLLRDNHRRQQLGAAARQRAESAFDIRSAAANLIEQYRTVLN